MRKERYKCVYVIDPYMIFHLLAVFTLEAVMGDAATTLWSGHGSNGSERSRGNVTLPELTVAVQARVVITLVLFVFSALANMAVFRSILRRRRVKGRSHVQLLMGNLSGAHLLYTALVMPTDAIWNITLQWHAGDVACRLLMFLKMFAMQSCAIMTVVISLDRQAVVANPLAFGRTRSKIRMLWTAWCLSALLAVPHMFLFHTMSPVEYPNFVQCVTHGSYSNDWEEILHNMFMFLCLFLLPFFIMVSCYCRILLVMSKNMREVTGLSLRRSKNIIPRARLHTIKMSIIIVVSFIICWGPYYTLGIWYWFDHAMLDRQDISLDAQHILFTLSMFNSCIDPVVYGIFSAH
uniref:Gonadotropin releasing hormone receptor 2 n=2 Tax=Eptatretus burgeri TaxID=7764 RepID=A0A8C4NFV1_EPTBU